MNSKRGSFSGGVNRGITRRDFLNGMLLGTGAVLLGLPTPLELLAKMNSWYGYGGVGDYAASHGNTEEAIRIFNKLRSGDYDTVKGAYDTGEVFDLVIVGGGLSGLGAAYHFSKTAGAGRGCLILESHPIFGGNSRRNEFVVNGQRLIGPQAANAFGVLEGNEIYSELGIPLEFEYQKVSPKLEHLQFDKTNFGYKLWFDAPSVGYFFNGFGEGTKARWVSNIWEKKLRGTPYSRKAMEDLLRWRADRKGYRTDQNFKKWLDTMTYKEYIEDVMGMDPEVTRFADPVLASTVGLGCDVISAYAAYQVSMPGFQRFHGHQSLKDSHWHSFPGGNDGITRYFIKKLVPEAIRGDRSFADIQNGHVDFGALDREENRVRMRLGAAVISVAHESSPEAQYVSVTYIKGGNPYRLKARSVIMASGSGQSRLVVRDLPQDYKEAYGRFFASPMLVANVAVTNWRYLYKLGLTACRWFEGFGFGCNVRRQMVVGDYNPPLDPDNPTILTFYVPFSRSGLPIKEQGDRGREELLSTSFDEYERQIRRQMVTLFGEAGFDPKRDISGIILNRWTHGYLTPQPGFYFGRDGLPAPPDVIRKRFGRISFAHSELNGHQHWLGAVGEGIRAANQVMETI